MRKALSAILAPLLLLTGTLLANGPVGAGSRDWQLIASDAPRLPVALPSDTLRGPLPALKTRSPDGGQGVQPALARPASSTTAVVELQPEHNESGDDLAPVAGSARRFPSFPTGPPLHA
jgi:hypothetical protein